VRFPIAAVLIAILIPVAAGCGKTGEGAAPAVPPGPSASTAAGGERKDELCLAYRQSQGDVAAVFLEAVDILTAADPTPAEVDEAKRKIAVAFDRQKSRLEAELAKPADPETTAAIGEFLKTIDERKSQMQAAGGDAMKVAEIVLSDREQAAADKVLAVCAERGLLPKP
jgi:hypothetical protein